MKNCQNQTAEVQVKKKIHWFQVSKCKSANLCIRKPHLLSGRLIGEDAGLPDLKEIMYL